MSITQTLEDMKVREQKLEDELTLAELEVSRINTKLLKVEQIVEQLELVERRLVELDQEPDMDDTLDTTQVMESTPGGTPNK